MALKLPDLLSQVFPLDRAVRITVRGDSMYPYLLDGDAVDIVISKDLKRGDVIVFRYNDVLIAHRVIRVEENQVIARGDATRSIQENVERSRILGKVIARYRNDRLIKESRVGGALYARLLPWSRLAHRALIKFRIVGM